MTPTHSLKRQLGLPGAVLMGLGSIIGTGVFLSIGIAAGVAGPAVIVGMAIGAIVAACNGLNSAQLAANHPVSGGSYEYGYKYLTPWLGFTAGWMFLLAKTASAATAALGFASYLAVALGINGRGLLIPIALATVFLFTGITLAGIQRSNWVNTAIVAVTLFSLTCFVLGGLPSLITNGSQNFVPFVTSANGSGWGASLSAILHASALMFVAYTGYGRIATLGEEVQQPRRIIPRAIWLTLGIAMLLYVAVAVVSVGSVGAASLSIALNVGAAPLEFVARTYGIPGLASILTIGAITAMLGVLLNLILGLSRMLLAMARRGDMPSWLAKLNDKGTTPTASVLVVGSTISILVLVGNVKTTWSFSAFTVLIYYAITSLAALNLPPKHRLYPRWLAWLGLLACLFLAFWVDSQVWLLGLFLISIGLIWHTIAQVIHQVKK